MCAPVQGGQGHARSIHFVLCLGSCSDVFSSADASWPCCGAALSPLLLTGMSDLPSVVSPVHLQCNQIHHGLRSGIVVLGNGKGIIRNNQIFSNKEAGIYILYHGNPVVRYVCASVLRPSAHPWSLSSSFIAASLLPVFASFETIFVY